MMSLILCVLPIRMMLLLTLLTLGSVITTALPEIVEPGPNSGIVLREQARLLITNCHWLGNIPARTATLTYDQHDTATRISLPDKTLD